MDNQTIHNAFQELNQDQKMVLTCAEHTYVLYHEDILCMGSGNDLQINKEFLYHIFHELIVNYMNNN